MNQAHPQERPNDVLVQFWDSDAPAEVQTLLDSVRDANPGADYRFFDDVSAADFIRDAYGSELLGLFENAALPAMRSDLFRYAYLARHGGFYLDADYGALLPIEPLLDVAGRGIFYVRHDGICNGALYVRDAGDPLMEAILERAIRNVSRRSSDSVWALTGPAVIQYFHKREETRHLFDGFRLIDDLEFARHFTTPTGLPYKKTDAHWLVARRNGVSPFRV